MDADADADASANVNANAPVAVAVAVAVNVVADVAVDAGGDACVSAATFCPSYN